MMSAASGPMTTNSLLHPWGDLGVVYAHPPPVLLGRLLSKILQGNVEAALIRRRSILAVPAVVSHAGGHGSGRSAPRALIPQAQCSG
jgi:hypothetical protein